MVHRAGSSLRLHNLVILKESGMNSVNLHSQSKPRQVKNGPVPRPVYILRLIHLVRCARLSQMYMCNVRLSGKGFLPRGDRVVTEIKW